MARRPQRPTEAELLLVLQNTERRVLTIASRWSDSLPPKVRRELLIIAHGLLRVLIRANIEP